MRFIQRTQPIFDDLDRFFNRSLGPISQPVTREQILESPESYVIRLDLPGFTKSEIGLTVTDRLLKLSAEATEKRSFTTSVSRQWKLGNKADDAGISAKLENGVFEITVPKLAPVEPETREITIN